ncbi:MAG: hypothetical protein RL199_1826, partial [Pseudomonadota bacterium]
MRHALTSLALLLATLLAGTACGRTDLVGRTYPLTPATADLEEGLALPLQLDAPAGLPFTWTVTPPEAGTIAVSGGDPRLATFTAADELSFEGPESTLAVTVRATTPVDGVSGGQSLLKVRPRPAVRLVAVDPTVRDVAVGRAVDPSLVVAAFDALDRPVRGVPVAFAADGAETVTVPTDESGLAMLVPMAPTKAGEWRVVASTGTLASVTFAVAVRAGPAATLAVTHPAPAGRPGYRLDEPAVVTATDAYGNPTPGLSLEAEGPSGTVTAALAEATDDTGTLAFTLTPAPAVGVQTFVFSDRIDPSVAVALDVTVRGGPAVSGVVASGQGQSAGPGGLLGEPLVAQLLDEDGFPASSGAVVWASSDGGSVDGATKPDEGGRVAARAVVPTTAGPVRFTCSSTTVDAYRIVFTAATTAGSPARLVLVSGDGQSTTAGLPFGAAFSVQVQDEFGNGVPDVPVAFESVSGDGSVTSPQVVTDATGLAQTLLTAGAAGEIRFQARLDGIAGSPLVIAVTAVAAQPSLELRRLDGDMQAAPYGAALPAQLRVKVLRLGLPSPGDVVTFAVALGGGIVLPATVTAGADGVAAASATLGRVEGPQRFSASVAGAAGSPVFFEALATTRQATRLVVVSGDAQSGGLGATLAQPLVVQAVDEAGVAVHGAAIRFEAVSGGSVASPDVLTDDEGRASTGATLSAAAGENRFRASLVGLDASVEFTATSRDLTPQLRVSGGTGQSGPANSALGQPLEVTVALLDGTPVEGVVVRFRALAPGASVASNEVATDARGKAGTLATLGAGLGVQTFEAAVDSANPSRVTIEATALDVTPARLVIVSGDGQTAQTSSPLPASLVLRVTNAAGGALAGIPVSFSAVSGGGSVSPAVVTTGADGQASVRATLGPVSGPQAF